MGCCISGQEAGTSGSKREARGGRTLHDLVPTQVLEQRGKRKLDDF